MEPTASTFAQKKRSSVEYESHERSDGSACDIIDGFEVNRFILYLLRFFILFEFTLYLKINSFESEEELNCFAKKQELGPRYQTAAMREGSNQLIEPSIQPQVKIEPSLSDEWMEIDEQV